MDGNVKPDRTTLSSADEINPAPQPVAVEAAVSSKADTAAAPPTPHPAIQEEGRRYIVLPPFTSSISHTSEGITVSSSTPALSTSPSALLPSVQATDSALLVSECGRYTAHEHRTGMKVEGKAVQPVLSYYDTYSRTCSWSRPAGVVFLPLQAGQGGGGPERKAGGWTAPVTDFTDIGDAASAREYLSKLFGPDWPRKHVETFHVPATSPVKSNNKPAQAMPSKHQPLLNFVGVSVQPAVALVHASGEERCGCAAGYTAADLAKISQAALGGAGTMAASVVPAPKWRASRGDARPSLVDFQSAYVSQLGAPKPTPPPDTHTHIAEEDTYTRIDEEEDVETDKGNAVLPPSTAGEKARAAKVPFGRRSYWAQGEEKGEERGEERGETSHSQPDNLANEFTHALASIRQRETPADACTSKHTGPPTGVEATVPSPPLASLHARAHTHAHTRAHGPNAETSWWPQSFLSPRSASPATSSPSRSSPGLSSPLPSPSFPSRPHLYRVPSWVVGKMQQAQPRSPL